MFNFQNLHKTETFKSGEIKTFTSGGLLLTLGVKLTLTVKTLHISCSKCSDLVRQGHFKSCYNPYHPTHSNVALFVMLELAC